MVFASNVDPAAFTVVDSGVKRQPSDALKIAGHVGNLCERAALAKRCILFEYGRRALLSTKGKGLDIRHQITNAEIVAYCDVHKGMLETSIDVTHKFYKMQERPVLTPTDWAFCHWMFTLQMFDGGNYEQHQKRVFNFLSEFAERCNARLAAVYTKLDGMKPTDKLAAIVDAFKKY